MSMLPFKAWNLISEREGGEREARRHRDRLTDKKNLSMVMNRQTYG